MDCSDSAERMLTLCGWSWRNCILAGKQVNSLTGTWLRASSYSVELQSLWAASRIQPYETHRGQQTKGLVTIQPFKRLASWQFPEGSKKSKGSGLSFPLQIPAYWLTQSTYILNKHLAGLFISTAFKQTFSKVSADMRDLLKTIHPS